MSTLSFPRLHFRGFARANVPTANRNTHGHIDITTNTVFMEGAPFDLRRPPSVFHAHLKRLAPRFDAEGRPDSEGVFSEAAGHNFGGNNHFSWENVRVTGVQRAEGAVDTEDSLVGASLALWGHYNDYLRTTFNRARWVDNNPSRPDTTLIYAGQLTLSDKHATPHTPSLLTASIPRAQPVRWVRTGHIVERGDHFLAEEFGRARLFQFSVSKQDAEFPLESQAAPSPGLRALRQALHDEEIQGLTVQYALFNMSTPRGADSPVFYDLMGTLGLWCRHELETHPAGRLLLPRQSGLGPVVVKVQSDRVSLNMPTAVPFTTRSAHPVSAQHPTHHLGGKQPLGDLVLRDLSGARIANIPERLYLDHWRHHGILDVPLLSPATGSLLLTGEDALWTEVDWVVQSDSNHLFLEAPHRQKGLFFPETLTVQSRLRGELASASAVTVRAEDSDKLTAHLTPSPQGEGYAQLTLTGQHPGVTRVALGAGQDSHVIDVRILPDDWHLDEVPAEQVDYAFLYQHVMSYYELLYPFMSDKVFSLADRCKCETYSRLMWQMCDPLNRDKSYYMPSTRELSLPKSKLFLKYLVHLEGSSRTSSPKTRGPPPITCKVHLVEALRKAVDLELSLLLQYLYAAYSIPNHEQGLQQVRAGHWRVEELELACGSEDRRRNSGMRGTLLEIAHEEMIHYLVMNNLLMALGEPFHPGTPRWGVQARRHFGLDTEFSFEPFSEHVLARFIRLEWPGHLAVPGNSIADLYSSIRQGLRDIPELFDTRPGKRGGEHHLFLDELTHKLFPAYQLEVFDRDSALFSIDFVTRQGEGLALAPPDSESSHFQRLRRMASRFSALAKPFEPAVPALRNPSLEPREDCAQVVDEGARALMGLYQGCHELMFSLMAHHFAQRPLGSLRRSRLMNASIDIMTGLLRPLSITLMNLPSGLPGRTAGPPVPEPIEGQLDRDYATGCRLLAQQCLTLARRGRDLGAGLVGAAQVEMLEFFHRQLLDLAQGNVSREA
ncbi:violacein biosynthesis protein vioB [Myxococcus stipitatus DSM 14675]|uniref:Violacein biosynthesis protein vioB n=1 Tax=Myxococcus stipitatus (strain DSM 14675 / JCM 12634 / Mx s8) TaxID=1278073 RepID=L7U9M5_MYXSD|nr:iminophenyl-pyruvate dimer synthase VioB [Myxococcus stipitatus]AGC43169.1 violacein biosynthesis protein vioB [Myxococcus stipitatus DSM 14675]